MQAAVANDIFHIDYVRPLMYPKQYAAIFEPKRLSLIEASTKAGKTSARRDQDEIGLADKRSRVFLHDLRARR